jgi:E3 ubiquitin-protein ligase HERC2
MQGVEETENQSLALRPSIVRGFGGVRVRRDCAGSFNAYAIGEAGELFSWGDGEFGLLGHGDQADQRSPKRVEALRGVRVSSVAVAEVHAVALAEDGQVYAWGLSLQRGLLGNLDGEEQLIPKPVEALRGMRVGSIAAAGNRSYAVVDTGQVWMWGEHFDHGDVIALGHGERIDCPLPKPIESLRGVKVDAVTAAFFVTRVQADDGSVYAWGCRLAAQWGLLGLGSSVCDAGVAVPTPQLVPALRVAIGQ